MNQTAYTEKHNLTKQNSVDILFKGIKRQISQRSYSKIKNSYKKKPIEIQELKTPQLLISAPSNRTKLRLSIVQNKITDPEIAHDELIKLKEANHKFFEENTELLRKIRKEEKIEEIYRKKLQGQELIDLEYFKVMEIKLLLEVERLENELEDKEKVYDKKVQTIRAKKNFFKDEITEKRIELYGFMINSEEELKRTLKDKKIIRDRNEEKIEIFKEKFSKTKSKKQEQNEILNQIKSEITQLKEKFKVEEAITKREQKDNAEMLNITNLMSNIMTNSQKSQLNKETSTAILKNNMSSISIKNKNSIEEIEKEIERIKEEYDMINNEIQEFMDEKIKQKLLINKEIFAIEEVYKLERNDENMKMIYENSALMRKDVSIKESRVNALNKNSMKNSLVIT